MFKNPCCDLWVAKDANLIAPIPFNAKSELFFRLLMINVGIDLLINKATVSNY